MTVDVKGASILIIDDDAEIRYSLQRVLSARNFRVATAANGKEGIRLVESERPNIIFLDNRMEGMSGIETLQHLRDLDGDLMIILMTAFGTTQTAIEAMKFGAFDYIVKPFDVSKVLKLTEDAARAHGELLRAQGDYTPLLDSEDYKEGIVGSSETMREVFKTIGKVAASEVTVMITGESGTGKELVARCVVQHSHRSDRPFMAVNSAAIPDNLIESELFGHEKGAFTGATAQRSGKFELCDGGTIFLDEIGDMSLSTQTKILRVLQEGEIQRVGGSRIIKVDVRLLAATNQDLERLVAEKKFREDLYYRLNVVRIRLPSLCERAEDIPQLIDYILQRMAKERRGRPRKISSKALSMLEKYKWPGNVRELENVVYRSAVIARGDTILPQDLPHEIRTVSDAPVSPKADTDAGHKAENENYAIAGQQVASAEGSSAEPEAHSKGRGRASADSREPGSDPAQTEDSEGMEIGLKELYTLIYKKIRREHDRNILQVMEKEMIRCALRETGGNQVKTSGILGITRATLRKRIDQHSLHF